jgi:hypothetical protein
VNTTVLRDNAWARFNGRRPLVKITRASPTAGDRYELRDVDTDQVLKSPQAIRHRPGSRYARGSEAVSPDQVLDSPAPATSQSSG